LNAVYDPTVTDGGACVPSAVQFFNVPIAPCSSLIDNEADAGVTAIEVVPTAALGSTGCAVGDAGGVTTFQITPASPVLATPPPVSCGTNVVFSQGVVAGQTYVFTLRANDDVAPFVLQSSCFATTYPGIQVTAQCDPLVPVASDAGM
jgi:hypothetical protein